jgi:hypothetical protein
MIDPTILEKIRVKQAIIDYHAREIETRHSEIARLLSEIKELENTNA